jgi:hypothetical protein
MITVTTSWEDIDEYPTAGDVSLMTGGVLVVTPYIEEGEDPTKVPAIAIYAPGAWQRVERDESATLLTRFLTERGLVEEWKNYGNGDEDGEE